MREKDYSLSFVRFIAMLMIVFCHIFQHFDSWISQFLNVGVQMFLFLSGYLHSNRNDNRLLFLLKKIKRLLVSYYVYLLPVLIMIMCFNMIHLDFRTASGLLTLSGTIHELGHLWFVPTILVCYFLTPLFWDILDSDYNNRPIFLLVIVNVIILVFFQSILKSSVKPAWITCYFLGMFAHNIYIYIYKKSVNILKFICIAICVAYLFVRVFWAKGILQVGNADEDILYMFFNYGHVSLGIVIVFMLRKTWQLIQKNTCSILNRLLDMSDDYSYEIYLVHHILVLGAYSVYNFIDNTIFGSVIAIIITCLWAFMIKRLSKILRKLLNRIMIHYTC